MTNPVPEDISAMRELLDPQAGFDPELVATCRQHIEQDRYDDAVLKAFAGRLPVAGYPRRSGCEAEG